MVTKKGHVFIQLGSAQGSLSCPRLCKGDFANSLELAKQQEELKLELLKVHELQHVDLQARNDDQKGA